MRTRFSCPRFVVLPVEHGERAKFSSLARRNDPGFACGERQAEVPVERLARTVGEQDIRILGPQPRPQLRRSASQMPRWNRCSNWDPPRGWVPASGNRGSTTPAPPDSWPAAASGTRSARGNWRTSPVARDPECRPLPGADRCLRPAKYFERGLGGRTDRCPPSVKSAVFCRVSSSLSQSSSSNPEKVLSTDQAYDTPARSSIPRK